MAGRGRRGELRNELSWSHSRWGTFQECLRRYYYHHYGSWGGWAADAEPLARRLYLLKNLKNRYLWTGGIVHDVVAGVLERVRSGLPLPAAEAAAEGAVQRMRDEFRQSRDGLYRQDPRNVVGLIEHHYSETVPDTQWQAQAAMVRRSVGGFFAEPYVEILQQISRDDWLALEELEEFRVDDTRVYVKMDLAFRRPEGGVAIVDWKTGRRRPRPEGLQLGVYALYAVETWKLPPEEIQVVEVNLSTREAGSSGIRKAQLDSARATIRKGLAEMRARLADPEENVARLEDFPAAAEPRVCARCPFREACPEYQSMAADPATGAGSRAC